ncbi:MAG: TIGR04053 family radical SAM/SPASM domain-containing protein [Polyangiaceae bacterium]|nr:TIGR04053 family radical SAM/SPASM domain-containing protein [Polyangiaceae bacterium]
MPEALGRKPTFLDFDDHPLIAIWEMTQACDLVCQHCRASATAKLDPLELSTGEGKALLDSIAAMGTPLCILTGGDPAKRRDLVELVRYGARAGLTMALTPSGTPLMTGDLLGRLQEAGLARVAISVDGPTAAIHDEFRGVNGSFNESMRILREARELGLETQINFTLSRTSLGMLDKMADLAKDAGVTMFVTFLVIPTGRAKESLTLSAEEVEAALVDLAKMSSKYPFQVKTTGAPHFRRVLLEQHEKDVPMGLHRDVHEGVVRGQRGINDGVGFLFVSHRGDVYPSGFLPKVAGNIRKDSLSKIYRDSPIFRRLRDSSALEGKCGVCPFRTVCGGSRARAFATTGNAMSEDSACAYVPKAARNVEAV